LFVQLYRWFPSILQALTVICPETLVRWHRAGFRSYWRWKSGAQGGRPQIDSDLRALIQKISLENPLWGAPRIHGELLKLGFEVAQSSVAKYMAKRSRPPSQGWRTFLRNHAPDLAAMDLFVVPTISFGLLYALVIVRLDRRQLVWVNVTANPTAEWVARQITEAFPWEEPPEYLIRDRDRIFGTLFRRRLRAMGIRDKPIAPASPWQNGFAERLIGSIRRECTDHLIVLGGGASAPGLASLRSLLQRHQNPLVPGQRCAHLSRRSPHRSDQFTRDPWRTSSPLRPSLGFRYRQQAERYWQGEFRYKVADDPGMICEEIITSSPLVILEQIGFLGPKQEERRR
jgi:transposase InsO family protein